MSGCRDESDEHRHLFKEIEPGVFETTVELITPCPFHEEDYWGACPCDIREMSDRSANVDRPWPKEELLGQRHGWNLWGNMICVECPSCAFMFNADHEDANELNYTCPECGYPENSII